MKNIGLNWVIIPKESIEEYLTTEEAAIFNDLLDKIDKQLEEHGEKKEFYLCDSTKPYAKNVLREIIKGEKQGERSW